MSTKGLRSFRPKVHFTPLLNWMNDPNGMVYIDGIWHLYYQKNPDEPIWGPMYWGHATSKDLISWEHHPIALYPDELGYIFSGSMAYDKNNTSGFGKDGKAPMVAVYTNHNPENGYECQSIAYSLDGGFTFHKYDGNPVIDNPGIADFRDPKVFWNKKKDCWSMTLAAKDCTHFYASKDLKTWQKTGEFGREEDLVKTTWECSDLFPIQTEDGEKWVLIVSMMANKGENCAALQYFVGDFDGDSFYDTEKAGETLWLDFGFDNYAGVTFHNYDSPIYLGWGVSPEYANLVPTGEYAGLMTIARQLSLARTGAGYRLLAKPFGLDRLRENTKELYDEDTLSSESFGLLVNGQKGSITFENLQGQKLVIEVYEDRIRVDRSMAGANDFSDVYTDSLHSIAQTKRLKSGDIDLEILFDVSYLEVFADGGLEVASMTVYPDSPYNKVYISGDLKIKKYKL